MALVLPVSSYWPRPNPGILLRIEKNRNCRFSMRKLHAVIWILHNLNSVMPSISQGFLALLLQMKHIFSPIFISCCLLLEVQHLLVPAVLSQAHTRRCGIAVCWWISRIQIQEKRIFPWTWTVTSLSPWFSWVEATLESSCCLHRG